MSASTRPVSIGQKTFQSSLSNHIHEFEGFSDAKTRYGGFSTSRKDLILESYYGNNDFVFFSTVRA